MSERQCPWVSIIIPVFNEASIVDAALQRLPIANLPAEVIVVDGGSTDGTVARVSARPVKLVQTACGRALQMNAGAALASGRYLVFLHIDTQLPENFQQIVRDWREANPVWGFFRVRLSGRRRVFRIVETGINWRAGLTGAGTGDQVFFCRQEIFQKVGGFPAIALMEDVALSRRLNRLAKPRIEKAAVITSSRRWRERGIIRTVLQMWWLRCAYYCGVSPERLAQQYYPRAKARVER